MITTSMKLLQLRLPFNPKRDPRLNQRPHMETGKKEEAPNSRIRRERGALNKLEE